MRIIGITDDGFILEASKDDVRHILTATNGSCEIEKVKVGQKIPAIDYSMSISKVNDLAGSYPLRQIKACYEKLGEDIDSVSNLLSSTKVD